MEKYKNVFYTTLGDFANCGSFLEFLKENTDNLAFLDLKSRFRLGLKNTTLYIYKNQTIVFTKELLTIPSKIPESLAFLQHIVFFINILQALFITKQKLKLQMDITITTFSVAALSTIFARLLGLCKKSLLWHWDYMPLPESSNHKFLLQFVDPLDKLAIKLSNFVWYASNNQFEVRKNIGQIDNLKPNKHHVVHWGNNSKISQAKQYRGNELKILYMGSLLPEKGLLEILESMATIIKITNNKVKLLIAGEANNQSFKDTLIDFVKTNSLEGYVEFTGYAGGEKKDKLLNECDLGVAFYPNLANGVKNYAYYSDPAKLRDYISFGVPILISDIPEIHKELVDSNAALLITDLDSNTITSAITLFLNSPQKYFDGAFNFSKINNYKEYYKHQFESL